MSLICVDFCGSYAPFGNQNTGNWLVGCFMINVDLAIFQPYLDLEAGDNQSLKIQVARPGIEPRSSCSASQELNHSATAAPQYWKYTVFRNFFLRALTYWAETLHMTLFNVQKIKFECNNSVSLCLSVSLSVHPFSAFSSYIHRHI